MGQLTEELSHTKLQLKQQPASTHTLQAIMEAKVGHGLYGTNNTTIVDVF